MQEPRLRPPAGAPSSWSLGRSVIAAGIAVTALLSAGAVNADPGDSPSMTLQPLARIRGCWMLDHRRDDMAAIGERLGHTADGEVVRFGAARREDDLVGRAAEQHRDLRSRLLDRCASSTTHRVVARRIAEVVAEIGEHRVNHFRKPAGART